MALTREAAVGAICFCYEAVGPLSGLVQLQRKISTQGPIGYALYRASTTSLSYNAAR